MVLLTDRTIESAQRLQGQGHMADAERLYRDLLAQEPDTVKAIEGLGAVLYQQGRADEAAAVFARGVAIEPRSPHWHASLGEALRISRQFDLALSHLRTAVALGPTNVLAWNSLGLVALDLRQCDAAEHAFRTALRLNPRYVRAQVNLANALLALARPLEAIEALRAALRIEPNIPVALINLALILSDMRDPDLLAEAEIASRRAVTLEPRNSQASTALARVLRLRGQLDEARDREKRALQLNPGRQASPARERGVTKGGADNAEPAQSARAQYTQGLALLTAERTDEAEACLREAIRLDSSRADAWVALATVHAQRGHIELSCQSVRTALALAPDLPEAHWRLATNLLGRLDDVEVQAIKRLFADDSLTADDRALLHFGLAAVFDERGLYAQAAAQLDAANLHQATGKFARSFAYDPDQHSALIDHIIAHFGPERFAHASAWGDPDTRPVFVVGFPRSGTTLTEQVLASHPHIRGAGELHDIRLIFQALPQLAGNGALDPFEALSQLRPVSVQAAASRYRDTLDALAPAGIARVVDKMPDNINYLGLIALLFPNAKVIICRRDPRDIALSCWQTGFRSCSWNNDWNHIARRLADYERILAHWERVRPIRFLDLFYEDMVTDLEQHARRLIEFVGLDWDSACLAFHSHPRVVRTPSLVQVRQPVHARSAGRWRNYEPYLQPLFQAFERHGVDVERRRTSESEPPRQAFS